MSSLTRAEWHTQQDPERKTLWPTPEVLEGIIYPDWVRTGMSKPVRLMKCGTTHQTQTTIDKRYKPLMATTSKRLSFPIAHALDMVPFDPLQDLRVSREAKQLVLLDAETRETYILDCQLYLRAILSGRCNVTGPLEPTIVVSWSGPDDGAYPEKNALGVEQEITMDSCWDCLRDGLRCAKVGLILDGPNAGKYVPQERRRYRTVTEIFGLSDRYSLFVKRSREGYTATRKGDTSNETGFRKKAKPDPLPAARPSLPPNPIQAAYASPQLNITADSRPILPPNAPLPAFRPASYTPTFHPPPGFSFPSSSNIPAAASIGFLDSPFTTNPPSRSGRESVPSARADELHELMMVRQRVEWAVAKQKQAEQEEGTTSGIAGRMDGEARLEYAHNASASHHLLARLAATNDEISTTVITPAATPATPHFTVSASTTPSVTAIELDSRENRSRSLDTPPRWYRPDDTSTMVQPQTYDLPSANFPAQTPSLPCEIQVHPIPVDVTPVQVDFPSQYHQLAQRYSDTAAELEKASLYARALEAENVEVWAGVAKARRENDALSRKLNESLAREKDGMMAVEAERLGREKMEARVKELEGERDEALAIRDRAFREWDQVEKAGLLACRAAECPAGVGLAVKERDEALEKWRIEKSRRVADVAAKLVAELSVQEEKAKRLRAEQNAKEVGNMLVQLRKRLADLEKSSGT